VDVLPGVLAMCEEITSRKQKRGGESRTVGRLSTQPQQQLWGLFNKKSKIKTPFWSAEGKKTEGGLRRRDEASQERRGGKKVRKGPHRPSSTVRFFCPV